MSTAVTGTETRSGHRLPRYAPSERSRAQRHGFSRELPAKLYAGTAGERDAIRAEAAPADLETMVKTIDTARA